LPIAWVAAVMATIDRDEVQLAPEPLVMR